MNERKLSTPKPSFDMHYICRDGGTNEKIVRELVVAALESSAKLPENRALEVEAAIFALFGCCVSKVPRSVLVYMANVGSRVARA